MAKPIYSKAILDFLNQIDHHEIYKLHMAQIRDARRQFANSPYKLAKIDAIEAKIKDTYRQACLEAAE